MSVKHASEVALEPVGAGEGTLSQVLIGPDEGPNFALRRFVIGGNHLGDQLRKRCRCLPTKDSLGL